MQCTLPLRAFVDPEYPGWLTQGIPRKLRTDLEQVYGPGLEEIPWEAPVAELFRPGFEQGVFSTLLADVLVATHNPSLAFHGMPHHQRVLDNGDEGVRIMQHFLGAFPAEMLQAHLYAMASHDLGHPGASFFALAEPGRIPVDDDVDPSMTPVEAYTAKLVDLMMVRQGFSLLARLVGNYTVVSSAFGAAHPEFGPKLQLERVQPRAILGCHMRVTDVTPPAEHTAAINDETALTYLEVPAFERPITWREYLESRTRFLQYVERMQNLLDESISPWLSTSRGYKYSLTRELGWRGNLERSVRTLARISGHDPAAAAKTAILRARLHTLGVVLA